MRQFVEVLQQWDIRVCGVFLVDSKFMVSTPMFFSGVLSALSAMVQLEIPHINVMSKMDLLSKDQANDIERLVFDVHSADFHPLPSIPINFYSILSISIYFHPGFLIQIQESSWRRAKHGRIRNIKN